MISKIFGGSMKGLILLALFSSAVSFGVTIETTYKVKSRILTGTKNKRLPTFKMYSYHDSESSILNMRAAKNCQLTIGGEISHIVGSEEYYSCVSTKSEVLIDKNVIQTMLYKMSEFSFKANEMYDLSDRILRQGMITGDQSAAGKFINRLLAGFNKPYLLSTQLTTNFLMEDTTTGNKILMSVEPIKKKVADY